MNRKQRRKLEKQERKEIEQQEILKNKNKGLIFKGIGIAIVLIIIIGIIFAFISLPPQEAHDEQYNTQGLNFPIRGQHWHATPTAFICGEQVPTNTPTQGHLGTGQLHTHEDAQIHIEADVYSPEQITIGRFMTNIGMIFNSQQLINKTNGDTCPDGTTGQVKLIINGKENYEYENYIVRDGDKIEMRFE